MYWGACLCLLRESSYHWFWQFFTDYWVQDLGVQQIKKAIFHVKANFRKDFEPFCWRQPPPDCPLSAGGRLQASKAPPQTFPWTYLPHIPWNWRWTFSLESEIKLEMNMEQCASNATQLNLFYSWIRVTYWPEICFNKELFFTFMCKSESLRSWYVCKSESGTSWCEFAVSNENIAIISPIHCIFIGWWHKINVWRRFSSSFQALTKAFLNLSWNMTS